MKRSHDKSWFPMRISVCALALLGCGHAARDGKGAPQASSGSSSGSGGTTGDPGVAGDGGEAAAAGAADDIPDPGLVRMRLLTRAQYHNSVADLLGVEIAAPAKLDVYPSDTAQIDDLSAYFDAATEISERVFAAPALPALLTCAPGVSDRDCALSIIDGLGARAFRRPLLPEQHTAFVKLYDSVIAGGDTQTVALKQIVRGLLVSMQFLYRVEFTGAAPSNQPYLLDSYAIATRLSYLLSDTTPDSALAAAADNDELGSIEGVDRAFDRLSAGGHSRALGLAFGSSWLGIDTLSNAGTPLASSLQQEVGAFLGAFFDANTALNQVLTLDMNYVDQTLVGYYGAPYGLDGFAPITLSGDHRQGLLGLGGVLRAMSLPDRVSISQRGEYVQTRLLCNHRDSPLPLPAPASTRSDLEALTASVACQACHAQIDPIGFGLAHFDQAGNYRGAYSDGTPLDSAGTLADGSKFDDEPSLSNALAREPGFAHCLDQRLAEYALGRALVDADSRYLGTLDPRSATGFRDSLRAMTHTAAFRYRRATPE